MSMSKCLPADMPVGFRFEPKEEEICCHYLWLKIMGKDSEVDHVIAEVDFGDSDPWDLPSKSRIESDDQIWWFFCRQDVGKTIKRTTKSGYWKITGKEREIKARNTKICIGKKKIVVFLMGKSSAGRKTNWVIHEYHPLVQNPQRPYIICRLEKKADKKDATPGCDVGEPSASAGVDNISDIENPVAPSAISEELGHAEVNAALLSQPLLSSDWLFPEEDKLYLSELFDDEDPKNNCVMDENQPERDNSLPHQGPDVTSHLEDKTNEMAGTPSCDDGEPSSTTEILSATENPVAPAAISEFQAHVHTEVNADLLSQPFLPGGCYTEDDVFCFSNFFDDDQRINGVMDESHPELENYLPYQGPHVISRFENKTEEMGGTPDCFIGKPSGNIPFDIEDQVAPNAIQEVHGLTEVNSEKENSMIFSNSFNDGHNMMQVQFGADELEESSAEFLDELIVDPYENDCGETTKNRFNNSIQPKSLKRLYFPDGLASVDTNVEGVDGRVKRFRSLHLENNHVSQCTTKGEYRWKIPS